MTDSDLLAYLLPPDDDGERLNTQEIVDLLVSKNIFLDVHKKPYRPHDKQLAWLDMWQTEGYHALLASRHKGKTEIVTQLGAVIAIYNNRRYSVGIMSRSKRRANSLVRKIKAMLEVLGVDTGEKSEELWTDENESNTPNCMALSLDATFKGFHFDTIIFDDPLEYKDEYSETFQSLARNKFEDATNYAHFNIILISQLLSRNDFIYDIKQGKYTECNLVESWLGDIPEIEKPLEFYEKRLSRKLLSREQLGFIDDEEAIFMKIKTVPEPESFEKVLAFIDPAYDGADRTALAIVGLAGGMAIASVYSWRKNWADCAEEIVLLINAYGIDRFGLFYEAERTSGIGLWLKDRGIGARHHRSTQNKKQKIHELAPYVSLGKLALSEKSDHESAELLRKWHESDKHDDVPDALAMAMQKIKLGNLLKSF